jgi:nitrate reductase NapAB chaperone NapD
MLVVVEKLLDQIDGHHQTQIKAIENLAGKPADMIITSKSNMVLQNISNVEKVLSTREDRKNQPYAAINNDVYALKKIFEERNGSGKLFVIIPTTDEHDFRVCLKLLKGNPNIATFSLRVLVYHKIDNLSDDERADLAKLVNTESIVLLTETVSLAKLLKDKYNLPAINSFLLPCTISANKSVNSPKEREAVQAQNHLKIGYLGGFRREKGASKLPEILTGLKNLVNQSDSKFSIEFIMQKAKYKSRFKLAIFNFKLMRSLRNKVKPDREIKLTILDEELSPALFINSVESVDLLLIPYDVEKYRARGSGIIIDGVLAEKPIVYTEGIGMNEFLNFGNAEAATQLSDFSPNIMKILLNLQPYRNNAKLARNALCAQIQKTSSFLKAMQCRPD